MAVREVLGSIPSSTPNRWALAGWRALRTLVQGVAGAFPSAGAGGALLSVSYWQAFGYSCLAAGIAALVSLLQNIAKIFPDDPNVP